MYLKQIKAYALIALLFSPVFALIYGLKHLETKGKRLIITLFGVLYGFLLTYTENNDAGAYNRLVQSYYYLGWDSFVERFIGIVTLNPPQNSPDDLYIHILFGIAGSIFQSTSFLFSLVGGVYGYFFGRAILKIIDLSKVKKMGITLFILILLFLIHRNFDSMQTIRSWTGMWILFNGVYSYHETKKKRYLILILIAPLFHLMYGFIAIPALLSVILVKVPNRLIMVTYFISFFLSVNSILVVQKASENDLASQKLGSYYRISDTGEEIDPIANRHEESNAVWYAKIGKSTAVYNGATAFILLLIIGGVYSKNRMTQVEYGLATSGILMASLANFLSFAFALYSRTMANATIYILAVMVLLALRGQWRKSYNARWKIIGLWLGIIIFIPKIVFFASDFLTKTSVLIFFLPFLKFFDGDFSFSIRDAIDLFL